MSFRHREPMSTQTQLSYSPAAIHSRSFSIFFGRFSCHTAHAHRTGNNTTTQPHTHMTNSSSTADDDDNRQAQDGEYDRHRKANDCLEIANVARQCRYALHQRLLQLERILLLSSFVIVIISVCWLCNKRNEQTYESFR